MKNEKAELDLSVEILDNVAVIESWTILARGTLEYIGYGAFSKWGPEIQKVRVLVRRSEIYIDPQMSNNVLKILNQTEKLLDESVRKIAGIALKAGDENMDQKKLKENIRAAFSDLQKNCWESFRPIKEDIVKEIRAILVPK